MPKTPRRATTTEGKAEQTRRLHVHITLAQWRWLVERGAMLAVERGGGRMSAASAVRDLFERAMQEKPGR